MAFELGGYPTTPNGVAADVYQLAVFAGREYEIKSSKYIYCNPIAELEASVKSNEAALTIAKDPDVAISSANPNQFVWNTHGNYLERNELRNSIVLGTGKLSSRKTFIYNYVLELHYALKFSNLADDIFTRIRERVDTHIGKKLKSSIEKFSAVYDNLKSSNKENWSNAVHSCRRILKI